IGNNNTANGRNTLVSNTMGVENTSIGNSALDANTTGNNNTANGSGALGNNTTGSNNTALGFNAGSSLTNGSNKIDIAQGGVAGESGKIRIGTAGKQTATYIAGIYNVSEGGTIKPVYI